MELQPIYEGVHKTLCINFRACAAFFPKIMYISLLDRNDFVLCLFHFILPYNFFYRRLPYISTQ